LLFVTKGEEARVHFRHLLRYVCHSSASMQTPPQPASELYTNASGFRGQRAAGVGGRQSSQRAMGEQALQSWREQRTQDNKGER
jgi:hypothetical protein